MVLLHDNVVARRSNINIPASKTTITSRKTGAKISASKVITACKESNINKRLQEQILANQLMTYIKKKYANVMAIVYYNAILTR